MGYLAEMTEQKPPLNKYLRRLLDAQFSSLTHAASVAGIPAERLRSALRRNTFNVSDLELILAAVDVSDPAKIISDHEFDEARRYARRDDEQTAPALNAHVSRSKNEDPHDASLSVMYASLEKLQLIARADGELEPLVLTLYESWADETTMFLFLHKNEEPVEWTPDWEPIRRSLIDVVLQKGGNVIYVVSTADDVTGEHIADDKIDKNFQRFAGRLTREGFDADRGPSSGFVALIRVPHCSYCVPDQKPALFLWRNDERRLMKRAFITADIPITIDLEGTAGTIVIPQPATTASHMVDFVDDLVSRLTQDPESNFSSQVRMQSVPSMEGKGIVQKLAGLI